VEDRREGEKKGGLIVYVVGGRYFDKLCTPTRRVIFWGAPARAEKRRDVFFGNTNSGENCHRFSTNQNGLLYLDSNPLSCKLARIKVIVFSFIVFCILF
jgi:hypothetical protein